MKAKKTTFSTDKEIKALKPKDKDYTLTDRYTQGLQLLIRVDGGKQWIFRYSSPILKDVNNKAKRRRTGFGSYPTISLLDARDKASELKSQISKGIDPLEQKQETKEQEFTQDKSQFHKVVYQWLNEIIKVNNANETFKDKTRTFERDIFPYFCKYDKEHNILSSTPIGNIHHSEVLKALLEKSKTAKETAKRLLADCNRIWIFAVSHGYCENNIIANISRDMLPKVQKKSLEKIVDLEVLAQLLHAIDNYKGSPIVRNALRLYPYTMLRAENMTALKWEYIDFENKLLIIPRTEMKVKNSNLPDFKLPLVDKAIEILHDIRPYTGWSPWVFHGVSNIHRPLNKESCNKALRVMGFNDKEAGTKQTQHSFRGTFRSLADSFSNEHRASFESKEAILDHHQGGAVERAYTHKADYTNQMRELLEWWEQFLERIKAEPHQ